MNKEYVQGAPYCLQIELTEGCNLRCPFCGLNGIRGKDNDYKFMTRAIAERISDSVRQAGWNPRIEFAMHGEPTMNPDMLQIIGVFRKNLPNAYLLMESNGGGLIRDPGVIISTMFHLGLNTLALDEYQGIKLVEKIFASIEASAYVTRTIVEHEDEDGAITEEEQVWFDKARVYDYPSCGPDGNPHQRKKKQRLVRVRPIDVSTNGTHATLNNHCGAGAPPDDSAQGKRCAKPFRELSFRWDGRVSICCNDWRGYLPVGDIGDMTVHEIWHSPIMYAARRKLYRGERDFGPCKGCNAKSYRPGLLPDHLGAEELEPADKYDEYVITEALKMGPLTEPVLRPWEKKSDD